MQKVSYLTNDEFNISLSKGEKLENLFEEVELCGYSSELAPPHITGRLEKRPQYRVKYNGKINYITNRNQLLFSEWLDKGDSWFYDYCALIKLNGKFNYLSITGELISPQWFDDCDFKFRNGAAIVEYNNKANLITYNGKIVLSTWWDKSLYTLRWDNRSDKLVSIKNNQGLYNFSSIKTGELLFNQWLDIDYYESFEYGFSIVRKGGKKDERLTPQQCRNSGCKFNYISETGTLLSKDLWFDSCEVFQCNRRSNKEYDTTFLFGIICMNDSNGNSKYNYITNTGRIVSPLWFDSCDNFLDKVATVYLLKNQNCKSMENWVWDDNGNYGINMKKFNYNKLKSDGTLLWSEWIDK